MRFLHAFLPAIFCTTLVAPSLAAENVPQPDARPNFVLINIDDLGYGDIGPYGSTLCRTPNLDRLAREGRKLTSHYAAPVCSPSRASLMTGCYPKRALPIPHVLFPASAVGLNPQEVTVAEVLKDAGYATACIGKWHLGDQPEFLPRSQGFDYYFGLPYSNDMGPAAEGAKSSYGQPLPVKKAAGRPAAAAETGVTGLGQPPLPLMENDQIIERVRAEEQASLVGRYTEKAVAFIRERRTAPFFLYLPHTAVHFPHYPSEAYRGKSGKGLLGDWIEEVDWSVGRVIGALDELGLSEKTLVFFTSDNGGPVNQGASNGPLRGGKGSTFEGGMRVCTIARWPGKIPAGTETAEITSMMDILPTFAKLAGGKTPADRKIDGGDIWPLLCGAAGARSPHDTFYYYRGFKLEAVRSGPWKLQLDKRVLYNLETDLAEAENVAGRNPQIVERLLAEAEKMNGDLGLDGVGPGCRPLGKVASPKPLLGHEGTSDYVGHWALHRGSGAGWLELRLDGGKLAGSLLWGGGSVLPLDEVVFEGDRVILVRNRQVRRKDGTTATASSRWEVRYQDGKLAGRALPANPKGVAEEFIGKRLPPMPPAPDLAAVRYGEPIELFNGRDLAGWELTDPAQQIGFKVVDGVLVNDPVQEEGKPRASYGNLMTTRKFEDFNLKLEVNVPEGSNSGVYLRGIYEIQICDSNGRPLDSHNMGGLYSRIAPSVAAEKPAGQWQSMEMTLCRRHLTVVLNGKTIIDNQPVLGVTGGALSADEFSPGPIYLQGDHGKVMFRNIILRPIAEW